jgi:hypothetical protein
MLREKNAHVLRVGGRGGGGEEKGFSFWDVASAEDSLPDGTGGAREPMCALSWSRVGVGVVVRGGGLVIAGGPRRAGADGRVDWTARVCC